MENLLDDRNFPFQIYRLIGAAEMCSHWMLRQTNEETQAMGQKLADIVNWYFEGGQEISRSLKPPSEANTEIKPPQGRK
jgi:hypothetical protein